MRNFDYYLACCSVAKSAFIKSFSQLIVVPKQENTHMAVGAYLRQVNQTFVVK